MKLLLFFPIIEIILLVLFGDIFGFLNVILWIIFSAIVGFWLLINSSGNIELIKDINKNSKKNKTCPKILKISEVNLGTILKKKIMRKISQMLNTRI